MVPRTNAGFLAVVVFLALAAGACTAPSGPGDPAAASQLITPDQARPWVSALGTCPSPTNDATLDMESGLPLLYGAYSSLGIFHVYWHDDWDSVPGNIPKHTIDQALRDVSATPYFDKLCQYGVPGMRFEGSADTGGLIHPCGDHPGPTVSTPGIFSFISCEEYAPFTGVPFSLGLPNPIECVACGLAPVDCASPLTLLTEPLCLATPNPTGNRVYVVLLPKGTVIDDFGDRSCVPGGYSAYHFQIPSRALPPLIPGTQGRPLNLAIIPTECFTDLADLVRGITHEVVEAATDPLPLAFWIDTSTATGSGHFDITHIGSLFTDGEAVDICHNQVSTFKGTGPDVISVAKYWSNADDACVGLDSTPPVSSAALSPAPNANGWNRTDVTATLTATDPGGDASGVKELVFSSTGAEVIPATTVPGSSAAVTFTHEGVSALAFHAVDNDGNAETPRVLTVRIDKTPPVVTWTASSPTFTYTVDQDVSLHCAAADALSGLASTTCADVAGPAWSFGLGPHTVSAAATDRADNAGSASATFTVEVTFESLCNLGRTFSTRPKVAERLCRLLERAAKATCCESVEEALEEFREKVRRAARLEWEEPDDDGDGDDGRVPAFTRQQSRLLREFSRALLPDECREPEDDGERGRLLASSRGDGGDGGGERCRRERRRD